MTDIDDLLRRSVRSSAISAPLVPWHEIERRARSAHRPGRRARSLLLCAVAIGLAGVLLLAGSLDRSGPSPLQRASAAVVDWPPNEILHLRVLTTYNFPQPDSLQESWQLTSPPYTLRDVSAFPVTATGARRVEFSEDASGSGQAFDWRSNEVTETSGLPAEWRPTGVSQGTREEMEAWIARSSATSLGRSEIDGRDVLGFEAAGWGQRIYVDAQSYLPVLAESFGSGVGDERLGYDQHYTWQLLPATPANLRLLDVSAQHPAATVVPLPQSAWQAVEGQLGGLAQPPVTPGA